MVISQETYLIELAEKLEAAKTHANSTQEYLQLADYLGIQAASVDALRQRYDTKALSKATNALARITKLLVLGAEPTTPPVQWYCGTLSRPKKVHNPQGEVPWSKMWPEESWPSKWPPNEWSTHPNPLVHVYRGAMPLKVLKIYANVQPLLDAERVYSPSSKDFEELRNPEPVLRDPLLIGMIEFMDHPQYFEIARWDIDADLAHVFANPATRRR